MEDHENKLEQHVGILEDNIRYGIRTRVVIYKDKDEAGECYADIVCVDSLLGFEATLNNDGHIIKGTCILQSDENRVKINNIKHIFTNLENHGSTIKSETCANFETFIGKIREEIKKIKETKTNNT